MRLVNETAEITQMEISLKSVTEPVAEQIPLVRKRVLEGVPGKASLAKLTPPARHLLGKHGKYLRPALVLLSCGLCGGNPDKAVEYGATIELVHVGSLVFDDLLDGSSLRRGRKTINAIWGDQTAVLTGTHLLLEATNRMAFESTRVREVLINTLNSMFEGEVLQFQSRDKFNLNEKTYMEIITGKSAFFLSACCRMGALAADAGFQEDIMGNFGLELGVAFQIRDDVLDLIAEPTKLGKELGSDLRDARMTMPLIHCVKNADRSDRRILKRYFGLNGGQKIDIKKVEQILKGTGSVAYCMKKAKSLMQKAISRLKNFENSKYKDALEALCHFVVERDY